MVAIAPFRALRYQDADPRTVTSPPHDVITDAERGAFLDRDPHNICALILPPGDLEDAGTTLDAWQADGTLVRDDEPALYAYEIRHGPPDARKRMRGMFCRIAIDPEYGAIKRHEMTLPKKRSTRLDLLRITDTNTEPIWMLYRDERGWVDEVLWSNALDEVTRFTDEDGNEHRLWRVDRAEAVEEIRAQFDDRTVVIADGHHRYATQCNRYAETGQEEDASMLVCLVRDTDPGLAIWPTDRLIRDLPFDAASKAVAAATAWSADPIALPDDPAAASQMLRNTIDDRRTCAVIGDDGAWILRLKDEMAGDGILESLAVSAVHDHLLPAWGFEPGKIEEMVGFTRSDEEAVRAVWDREVPLAVLLAPEPVEAVLDVAAAGNLMPQKSTYFVPKLRSGLLLSPCDEPLPTKWSDQVADGGKADFRMPKL